MRSLALVLLAGCSTTRALAPLEKGQHGATFSVGGPFVQFAGAPIPLPIASVGYQYGIDGKSNVHGAFYLTQLVLFKVGGFDVGINRELSPAAGARPRVMVDFTNYLFFGDHSPGDPAGGARWFPDVSLMLTWDLGQRPHRIYLGVDTFFQTMPEFHVYPSPVLGTELRASHVVGVQLELAYHAFWADTEPLQPVWYGFDRHGAIAFKLGLNVYVPTHRAHRKGEEASP